MKPIINIGGRAVEEMLKKYKTVTAACRDLGISRSMVYQWAQNEVAPSAMILAKLCHAGFDIKYILIGVRDGKV